MIGIINYGVGNIQSVLNAFQMLPRPVAVLTEPVLLARCDKIVLPGVGSFGACVERLTRTGFRDALLEEVVDKRKPLLGICVGMQMLADVGLEFGEHPGLGLIPGRVELIPKTDPQLRIPHIGWNDLEIRKECPILKGIRGETACYFVHSYHLKAARVADVDAVVHYGGEVTAVVSRDHIFGIQAHPEKSQRVGLKILENFVKL
jgi:glutamine amidotransferase